MWLNGEIKTLQQYYIASTWDFVLCPKAFGDFLKIPLNIPPASWNMSHMKQVCEILPIMEEFSKEYFCFHKLTLALLSTERLSALPESSLGADKSSWRWKTNIPHWLLLIPAHNTVTGKSEMHNSHLRLCPCCNRLWGFFKHPLEHPSRFLEKKVTE